MGAHLHTALHWLVRRPAESTTSASAQLFRSVEQLKKRAAKQGSAAARS